MKLTIKLFCILSLLVLNGCSTFHQSESSKLQGTWKGSEAGDGRPGECTLVVSENHMEFHAGNPNEWYKGTFVLRKDSDPKQVVCTITDCPAPQYIGKISYGLYRIEKGTMTLVGNEPGSPQPPSGFDDPKTRRFQLKKL
jgi:uncharacterized protein (TIGR03067 family)